MIGESLSWACIDPMVSARILNGLIWGRDAWRGWRQEVRGDGLMSVRDTSR